MKASIAVTCVCLLPILSNAQLRTPENVPIGFYGKVVDQNGQPVSGAKVTFDFTVSHMMEERAETTAMKLETDQDGVFALTGVTGYGIDKLSIQKTGYELSPKTSQGYVFGLRDYTPNPGNPVIFKMWKEQGKKPLISSSWRGKVTSNGTTNRFDLLNGRPSVDGNLEIICMRTPAISPTNDQFDHKFEIVIAGGGIQVSRDEFTYLAPENGYLPAITVAQKAGATNWRPDVVQEYYIKTADGHYGRLFVEWYAWQTPSGHCEWNCTINPSGSRNLER